MCGTHGVRCSRGAGVFHRGWAPCNTPSVQWHVFGLTCFCAGSPFLLTSPVDQGRCNVLYRMSIPVKCAVARSVERGCCRAPHSILQVWAVTGVRAHHSFGGGIVCPLQSEEFYCSGLRLQAVGEDARVRRPEVPRRCVPVLVSMCAWGGWRHVKLCVCVCVAPGTGLSACLHVKIVCVIMLRT